MSMFEQLVRQLLVAKKQVDRSLRQMQQQTAEIEQKYEPRNEFERWKQTVAGKAWKKQQHEKQGGLCVLCRCQIPLKGSHIDHIKPISLYPQLAIAVSNLQILCPDCNTQKGSQVTEARS